MEGFYPQLCVSSFVVSEVLVATRQQRSRRFESRVLVFYHFVCFLSIFFSQHFVVKVRISVWDLIRKTKTKQGQYSHAHKTNNTTPGYEAAQHDTSRCEDVN
jgi:hypothetical protein